MNFSSAKVFFENKRTMCYYLLFIVIKYEIILFSKLPIRKFNNENSPVEVAGKPVKSNLRKY